MLLKDFPLRMISDDPGVNEATKVEPPGPKLRHRGWRRARWKESAARERCVLARTDRAVKTSRQRSWRATVTHFVTQQQQAPATTPGEISLLQQQVSLLDILLVLT
jgi:hypothetical protein